MRQARARRGLASKDYGPSVSGSVSGKSSGASGGAATGNLYNSGFDASWEPDIFAAMRRALSAAQADLEASEASLYDSQVSLVAELALDYVELRAFQARITIARDNLTRQTETLS